MSKIICCSSCHLVPSLCCWQSGLSQYLLRGEEEGPGGHAVKLREEVLAAGTAETCCIWTVQPEPLAVV